MSKDRKDKHKHEHKEKHKDRKKDRNKEKHVYHVSPVEAAGYFRRLAAGLEEGRFQFNDTRVEFSGGLKVKSGLKFEDEKSSLKISIKFDSLKAFAMGEAARPGGHAEGESPAESPVAEPECVTICAVCADCGLPFPCDCEPEAICDTCGLPMPCDCGHEPVCDTCGLPMPCGCGHEPVCDTCGLPMPCGCGHEPVCDTCGEPEPCGCEPTAPAGEAEAACGLGAGAGDHESGGSYKKLKKDMKKQFEELEAYLDKDEIPPMDLVEPFFANCKEMTTYPDKGEEFYNQFNAQAYDFYGAVQSGDLESAKEGYKALWQLKKDSHDKYKD